MPVVDETASELERLLAWAFEGEIFGAALFDGLQAAYPERAAALATLAELERAMAAALAPVLDRHSVATGPADDIRRAGGQAAEAIPLIGWDAFLAQFDAVTVDALAKYRRLHDLAPAADAPVARLLIAHEEALRSFAEASLAGSAAAALQDVESVLAALGEVTAR